MTKDTIPYRSFGDIHKLVFETETDIGLYGYPRWLNPFLLILFTSTRNFVSFSLSACLRVLPEISGQELWLLTFLSRNSKI